MSSRLNLRSPRGPTRYVFTIPCSLHLLSVLLWMQRIRHASPVLSMLLGALARSGTTFLTCDVFTVSPVVSQPCGIAPGAFELSVRRTPAFIQPYSKLTDVLLM